VDGQRRVTIPAKLFVGNLSFKTSQDGLRRLFEPLGEVKDVFVAMDRATGKSRGFAFVEMGSEGEAAEAIRQLNGRELDGRALRINAAEDRPARRPGAPRDFAAPRGMSPSFDGGFGGDRFVGALGNGGRPGRAKGSRRNLRAGKRSL
jgi:cold-inducible RNA-binding protein